MNNVYLSSFFRAKQLPEGVVPYSAAVYQPSGYAFPKVAWTDIRKNGAWIRPRNFLHEDNPVKAYHDALYDHYRTRTEEAVEWAKTCDHDVALCCWCPFDKAARRQLKEWGSFICHTAVLSEFVYNELGVPVWEDGDRRHMAVLNQNLSGEPWETVLTNECDKQRDS